MKAGVTGMLGRARLATKCHAFGLASAQASFGTTSMYRLGIVFPFLQSDA